MPLALVLSVLEIWPWSVPGYKQGLWKMWHCPPWQMGRNVRTTLSFQYIVVWFRWVAPKRGVQRSGGVF